MDGVIYKAWLKKSLRSLHTSSASSLALGDMVEFVIKDNLAIIQTIYPPRTILCRESVKNINLSKILATNLDQVIIVISAGFPETPIGLIDRMIVASLSGGLEVIVCFNKIDETTLYGKSLMDLYENLPYTVVKISAKKHENLIGLKTSLKGKKSILLGSSGVGKSSIIKSITGHSPLISDINIISKKGCHCTTASYLYKLDHDTYLADIPGIKQLGFVSIRKVDSFFPEIYQASLFCEFSNCTHTKEESCQVKKDLQSNKIDRRRFESYLKIKEEIRQIT